MALIGKYGLKRTILVQLGGKTHQTISQLRKTTYSSHNNPLF